MNSSNIDPKNSMDRSPALRAFLIVAVLLLSLGVMSPRSDAAVTLDPNNPSNFTKDGTQTFTIGSVLTLTDGNVGDFIAFFAPDSDATAGLDIDVVATFQVLSLTPNNVDADNRIVINDGQSRSAIAACVIKQDSSGNAIKGIGLLSQGSISDPASYPVFVAVDWQTAPITIRLRRNANGDAELVEVNGMAPSPRALLAASSLPGATRTSSPTVEFGAASVEAKCTVAYSAFYSERVVSPYSAQVQQPINPDGSSVFSIKRGVVPIKFTLTFDGLATCQLPQATISLTRIAGAFLGSIDESTYLSSADSGSNFRIDSANCQYLYNLATRSLGPGTYTVNILIDGNIVGNATFGLK